MADSKLADKIEEKAATPATQKDTTLTATVAAYEESFALALRGASTDTLIDPQKFVRVALTAIRRNTMLKQANPPSLLGALMGCAMLGLEPHGPLGQAYLVPFRDNKNKTIEVQLIIGYQGLLELVYRSGRVTSIIAHVIHEADELEWEHGTNAYIKHKPALTDRGPVIGAYAIANLVGGGQIFDVLSKADIDARMAASKAKESGPWKTHYEQMARKSAVRQLFKWLPASATPSEALGADGATFREIPKDPEDIPGVIDVEDVEDDI